MLRQLATTLGILAFIGGGITAGVCLFLSERHPDPRYTRDEVYFSSPILPDPDMLAPAGRRLYRRALRAAGIAAVGLVLAVVAGALPR